MYHFPVLANLILPGLRIVLRINTHHYFSRAEDMLSGDSCGMVQTDREVSPCSSFPAGGHLEPKSPF